MSNPFMFDDNEPTMDDAGFTAETESAEEAPAESSNNRTFLIAVGVLGGIVLLSLICMAVYAMVFLPQQRAAVSTQEAQSAVLSTQAAVAQAETETAKSFTATLEPTIPPTETSTATPVIAAPVDTSGTPTPNATATMNALSTKLAQAQLTATYLPSPTALAETGFAEDVGLPGLFGMALALIVVILVARRMREAPSMAR
jgi:hypothetical protein